MKEDEYLSFSPILRVPKLKRDLAIGKMMSCSSELAGRLKVRIWQRI